jgi:pyruvate formate lyase activating enzyme
MPKEIARYWTRIGEGDTGDGGEQEPFKVHCLLCPKDCIIRPGKLGYCRVRMNDEGTLYTLNYGECTACSVDPTEKKPLYHFFPGSTLLSLGTLGCNFGCGFCQNWHISHAKASTMHLPPEEAVKLALEAKSKSDRCIGIAYTYSEPLVWFEYVFDTAKLAKKKGLYNVLITNGYVNHDPLVEILPFIDAMNVDIKGFSDEFYKKVCAGKIGPVLETVRRAYDAKCHVEVTTLLVPGMNDDPHDIDDLVDWLANIDPNIPLHFSRYFPNYKFSIPPTPENVLVEARRRAQRKLRYVYLGNVLGPQGSDTYCPECREVVIKRRGMGIQGTFLDENNHCKHCGATVALKGNVVS